MAALDHTRRTTMPAFLDENFLLRTLTARRLYVEVASLQPIFDYHCHLSPRAIAEDEPFEDIARLWLEADHYKWRLMRANGVPERLCAGDGPWDEKFVAYAAAITRAAGNPLLHWSHLELRRIFGIDTVLTPANALEVRAQANRFLQEQRMSPRALLMQFDVRVLCTTDDPADDLVWHRNIAAEQNAGSSFSTRVLPTFRPDRALDLRDPLRWKSYLDVLGEASGVEITSFGRLLEALAIRHEYFHRNGCRLSDHALVVPPFRMAADGELEQIFKKSAAGQAPSEEEQEQFATALLMHVARLNAAKGWTMQLHIGALRNVNRRLYRAYGPDVGGDTISDESIVHPLARLLGMLDEEGALPRTILYTLDSSRHEALAALALSLTGGPPAASSETVSTTVPEQLPPGRVQLGAAWWFNDQKDGMERHLREYAAIGLLGAWVGMLTDSRSFLSFPRHEYFRRILCNTIGTWVEDGELPDDPAFTESLVRGICWENARNYFGIEVP